MSWRTGGVGSKPLGGAWRAGKDTQVAEKITATPRVRRIQRAALTLLVISGAINTMDRAALAIANPLVRHDFGLSIAQMGALLSAFLWAYAFSQLPVGALIDRLGPRKLLTWGLALWSGAQLLCGVVTSMGQFFTARLLLGIGEAPQFPSAGRVVRDWFAVRDRGFATGIFNSASTFGTGLAAPVLTALMLAFGWRWMFIVMGVLGLAISVVWFLLYREPAQVGLTPEENAYRSEGDQAGEIRQITLREWGGLFRSCTTWGLLVGYFGVIYVQWVFYSWMPGYLEIQRHMSVAHTGIAAGIPYIFAVAGALSAGWLVDFLTRWGVNPINSRKLPLCTVLVLETGFVIAAALVPSNTVAIACLSGAMFFGTAATTYSWTLVTVVGPANCTGSLGSLQNFGGYIGGSLAPVTTGLIVQGTGSFVPALFCGAGMALFAAIAYFLLVRGPIVHRVAAVVGAAG
jgi:sugar phosphate permease